MSTAIYPVLPGLTWPVKRTPTWNTRVQKTASGRELRAQLYSYPLYAYELQYEFVRSAGMYQEFQALLGFFNARQGQFDTFYFDDPTDDAVLSSAPQSIGIGDGTTTKFQLVRSLGAFVEPVLALQGTPTIMLNGVATTAYTVLANGVIQFTTAPASGVAITWYGLFYWVVRFAQDSTEFEEFASNFWSLGKVELQTVKP